MKTPERRLADKLAEHPMFTAGTNLFATPPEPYSRESHSNNDELYDFAAFVFASGGIVTNYFNYSQPSDMVRMSVIVRAKKSSYTLGKKAVMAIQEIIRRGGFEQIIGVKLSSPATYIGKDGDDWHIWSIPVECYYCLERLPFYYGETFGGWDPVASAAGAEEQSIVHMEKTLTMTGWAFYIASEDIERLNEAKIYISGTEVPSAFGTVTSSVDGVDYSVLATAGFYTGSYTFTVY